jgi:two-component system, OmpR family, response regulator
MNKNSSNLPRFVSYYEPMKILIVEDEKKIANFINKGLREAGFEVEVCHHGDEGFQLAVEHHFDALVLDIMLPGRDGLSILKQLRIRRNAVPVILVSARGELNERLEGLDLGADDYLTKPFYMEELIARLHAVTRRTRPDGLNILETGPLRMNLMTREVHCGRQELELTVREFSLLEYLARSPGRVYTRTQILEQVWNFDFDPSTNIVDVYIRRLRQKLNDHRDYLETVRGVGYRLRRD